MSHLKSVNTKESKKIWIPKFKKSNCDANILEISKSKCDSGCSNYMNEDINLFLYFILLREDKFLIMVKVRSDGSRITSKSPNPTSDIFFTIESL